MGSYKGSIIFIRLVFLFVIILLSKGIEAQKNALDQKGQHKVREVFTDYVNKELQLSEAEKSNFWELYYELKDSEKKLKIDYDLGQKLELMSDSEVEEFIENRFEFEENLHSLRRKYYLRFKEVIHSRKVAKLLILEKKFKRKLVNQMRHKRSIRNR